MAEKISFIIPCYRSEHTILDVVQELRTMMENLNTYDFEIVLVNDASPDHVWTVIQKLCSDQRMKGIGLSRNFGQASAVMAGFANVSGDYIFVLDDDGQSPLDAVMEMTETLKKENYDAVYGIASDVQFGWRRRAGSKINGIMAKIMFGRPSDKRVVNISVLRRYIVEEIIKYQEPYPYLSGLVFRTTGNIGYVPVRHRARQSGTSGYSFRKLAALWMNGFTSFSIKPLRAASYLGFATAFSGLAGCAATAVNKWMHPDTAIGWSSIICVILLMGGMNLLVLGLLGEYLGRMYMGQNKTPQYVIRETINLDHAKPEEMKYVVVR